MDLDSENGPTTAPQREALEALKAVLTADRKEPDEDKRIDPDDDQDWFSLTLGFFLARGLTAQEAHGLSLHVRYDLQYWMDEE